MFHRTGARWLAASLFVAGVLTPATGQLAAPPAPVSDEGYLTTPNNPLARPLPVIPGATPGDGLVMQPGSRNAFSLIMGSAQKNANMTTSQSIRDTFFLNYMVGDLTRRSAAQWTPGRRTTRPLPLWHVISPWVIRTISM